jgi:hypothetical protein
MRKNLTQVDAPSYQGVHLPAGRQVWPLKIKL